MRQWGRCDGAYSISCAPASSRPPRRLSTTWKRSQDLLQALDYPDGMTAGLRRTTDVARSLIERSRADLTTTIVQERLRARLEEAGA